jgi:hypothetical protein
MRLAVPWIIDFDETSVGNKRRAFERYECNLVAGDPDITTEVVATTSGV